jgi:hypothetical protein
MEKPNKKELKRLFLLLNEELFCNYFSYKDFTILFEDEIDERLNNTYATYSKNYIKNESKDVRAFIYSENKIIVFINKRINNRKSFIGVLAHEMAHAFIFCKGENHADDANDFITFCHAKKISVNGETYYGLDPKIYKLAEFFIK